MNLNQNSKVYNKKAINKGVKNLNINNFINNNNSGGLITRNYNLTDRNKNTNKLNGDPSKSNDFIRSAQNNFNSNKNIKTNYKKNNIIINIINNNKNNNYNSTNNYFSNNTNTNVNTNTNINEININNNITFKTENNNLHTNNNPGIIYTDKNINKNTSNIAINNSQNTKIILTNPKSTSYNNNKNKVNKNIHNKKKFFKSKLLSFRVTDSNFIRNITEKIKSKSNSNSIKKSKNKSKTKSIISPTNNKSNNNNNVKKRTKTEILGNKTDIFIFGNQGDNNPYNKSINRQILKNINLTNNGKPHKDISLVNKKIIKYHFNINNINNSNKKIIKHTSTNSQNLTDVKIINRIAPFSAREIIKTKGVGVFSVNKTERTSRNHSKDKINKINNTTLKKNYLDSLSPKNVPDLINNKIHKIKNKNNNNMYTFWKSISSYKKGKNLKTKKNNNHTNVNNNNFNYQGINSARNNKDMTKRINIPKNS